jgi:hypothetical protein
MRIDNRVTQVPPLRTHEHENHEATSRSPAGNGRNRTRGDQPWNPNRTRASAGGPSQGGNSAGGASGSRDAASHGDAGGGGSGGGSSSHGAGRRAGGGGDRRGRGHADSHVTGVSRGGYDACRRIEEIRCKKSSTTDDNDGFPAFSARLRNLLLPEKLKPLGITKYDAMQDPVQWLRCYALSIENAGGNNDTKCLYFPSAWTKHHSLGSCRSTSGTSVVWISLGPLPRWVPGPTTRWAPGTTRLVPHGTYWREAQGLRWSSTRIGSYTYHVLYRGLLDVHD